MYDCILHDVFQLRFNKQMERLILWSDPLNVQTNPYDIVDLRVRTCSIVGLSINGLEQLAMEMPHLEPRDAPKHNLNVP